MNLKLLKNPQNHLNLIGHSYRLYQSNLKKQMFLKSLKKQTRH
jgi:hypothetical protein